MITIRPTSPARRAWFAQRDGADIPPPEHKGVVSWRDLDACLRDLRSQFPHEFISLTYR